MKTIALTLTCIMISQFFPAIVYGVRASNELDNSVTQQQEIENEKESSKSIETEKVTKEANVEETHENNEVGTREEKQKELQEHTIGEIIEKRTTNEKHFLQDDGTIIASVYPYDVHYNSNGELLDINNSLQEISEDEGMLENKSNSFKVKFAKKSNKNNLVKLNINNHNIKWSLKDSNKVEAIRVNNNSEEKSSKYNLNNITSGIVKYENILENIDVEYTVISKTIKEDIIIKDKSAINQQLVFEYNTDKLEVEKTEDGKIIFYEKNKDNIVFFVEAPYMYDAKGELSNDIGIQLTSKNNKHTIEIKPNKEWLESEERQYPITIDPTVQTSLNYNDIQDTYIFDGDSGYNTRHTAHILRVGSNNTLSSKNPTRSLIKFTLPQLNSGDQVVAAMLDICSYTNTSEWNPPSGTIQIDVHKMTSDWTSSTAHWSNLNAQYDSRIVDYAKYQFDYNNQIKFYYFDITSIVKDWYITGNNYGLMLKDHAEVYNAPHSDAYFFSSDASAGFANARPMVQILYRNQSGIEAYQTYHTQSVGRAGTVYVNDYNGNLVLLHGDVSTPGSLLPVSVNHVYNTNDKDIDIGYGKGFRLNLSQTIILQTINNIEYARYTDEDGTVHSMKKEGTSNTYKDEEGLGLTLTLESNGNFKMTDKTKNILVFQKRENSNIGQKWHLKELQNSFGNKIVLDLNTDTQADFRIQKVTDAAGDSITFTYDSGSRLETIKDKNGRVVRITYNQNLNISQITYWADRRKKFILYI